MISLDLRRDDCVHLQTAPPPPAEDLPKKSEAELKRDAYVVLSCHIIYFIYLSMSRSLKVFFKCVIMNDLL